MKGSTILFGAAIVMAGVTAGIESHHNTQKILQLQRQPEAIIATLDALHAQQTAIATEESGLISDLATQRAIIDNEVQPSGTPSPR